MKKKEEEQEEEEEECLDGWAKTRGQRQEYKQDFLDWLIKTTAFLD